MAIRHRTPRTGASADLLVVGLGNPGSRYADTRHNAGHWAIFELLRRNNAKLRSAQREHSVVSEIRFAGHRLTVAVPTMFMNESGRAVAALVRRHGITDLRKLVVVHDELDLPVGRMKVKSGGGLSGHNGLKSIRAHLRDAAFTRVRIGIGRPGPLVADNQPIASPNSGFRSGRGRFEDSGSNRNTVGSPRKTPVVKYVLSRPKSAERAELNQVVSRAVDAVEYLLDNGLEATMTRFNARV